MSTATWTQDLRKTAKITKKKGKLQRQNWDFGTFFPGYGLKGDQYPATSPVIGL